MVIAIALLCILLLACIKPMVHSAFKRRMANVSEGTREKTRKLASGKMTKEEAEEIALGGMSGKLRGTLARIRKQMDSVSVKVRILLGFYQATK
jgi:hypothetical protein